MAPRFRVSTLAVALLLAARGHAAAQYGTVHGRVFATSDRSPVAYALVRLAPQDPGAPVRTVLSDGQGSFSFPAVVPGTYRLRLDRIGFAAEQSDAFAVADGQTVERDFASAPVPVAIRGVVAASVCRTQANLQEDSLVAALWNEAVKGMELRRAFDDTYHYEFDVAQYTTTVRRRTERLDSLLWHAVVDPRYRPDRSREGWGRITPGWMRLEIPDGRELLDTAFLRTHCIDGGMDEENGTWTIGFRPVKASRSLVEVQGELRLDTATLQVKAIQVEWWQGARRLLEATVQFVDANVPGGQVRMPIGAIFIGGSPGREVRGQVLYRNFGRLRPVEPLPPAAPAVHAGG